MHTHFSYRGLFMIFFIFIFNFNMIYRFFIMYGHNMKVSLCMATT